MKKMKSKTELVKQHLTKKKTITSWDAINLYRATRLAAIIFNLRDIGWDIKTMPMTDSDGNKYAKYILK